VSWASCSHLYPIGQSVQNLVDAVQVQTDPATAAQAVLSLSAVTALQRATSAAIAVLVAVQVPAVAAVSPTLLL